MKFKTVFIWFLGFLFPVLAQCQDGQQPLVLVELRDMETDQVLHADYVLESIVEDIALTMNRLFGNTSYILMHANKRGKNEDKPRNAPLYAIPEMKIM